jgi:ABC-type glycerol-3-phosphate transport system substrate-binding protein
MKRPLVSVMMLALCGYLSASAQPKAAPAKPSQQGGALVAEAGSSRLNISLYFSLPEDQAQVLQGFVTEFQQDHPFVNVQTKNFPSSAQLYTQLASGQDLPSLAILESSWLPSLTQGNHLLPVETWMPHETFLFNWSVKCNTYVPLWDAAHIGENLMALPYFFTTRALILNNELLAKAGVKYPPVTWDQVVADASAISKKEKGVTGFSLSTSNDPDQNARDFQLLAWQAGAPGLNAQPELSQDAYTQVVQTLQTMKNALLPLDGDANTKPGPVGLSIGTVADYLQARKEGLPVRSALIPGFDKTNRLTETQAWDVGMFDNVPKNELYKVQEFAFFMLDFAQQRRWAEQTPYLAAHVKVFENPFYRQARLADHNSLRVFLNSLGKSKVVDTTGAARSLYGVVGKNLGQVVRGDRPISNLTQPQ